MLGSKGGSHTAFTDADFILRQTRQSSYLEFQTSAALDVVLLVIGCVSFSFLWTLTRTAATVLFGHSARLPKNSHHTYLASCSTTSCYSRVAGLLVGDLHITKAWSCGEAK